MSETGFLSLLGAALGLDRAALAAAADAAGTLWPAWAIAFVGGVSLTLGQSVVLFANRVSRRRFVVCLLVAGAVYVAGLAVWGATIWLVARYLFGVDVSVRTIVLAVCLGEAPLVFGFLILIPYAGSSIQRILDAYSLVVVVAALSAMLDIRIWAALALAGAGWALRAGLNGVLRRPLAGVRSWLWRAATGRPTRMRTDEVFAALSVGGGRDFGPEGRPSAG